MTQVNRMEVSNPDHVYGTLDEFGPLKMERDKFLSCGEPAAGVARCPFADICTQPFKGREGKQPGVDIVWGGRDNGDAVKRDDKGKPVLIQMAAGGPKNIMVRRTDAFTGRSKMQIMPCWRYYSNMKRWGFKPDNYPADMVATMGVEGDGQLFPMPETRERIVGQNQNGTPKWACKHEWVQRAIPFYPRPDEVLIERAMDLKIQDMIRSQSEFRMHQIVAGLQPHERPIQLSPEELSHSNEVKGVGSGSGKG